MNKLVGIIKLTPKIIGEIKLQPKIVGELKYSTYEVYEAETYKGDYEFTPLPFQEQILDTENKILKENIKIKEIPYYETSNVYGDTVYIGSQI